MADELQIRGRWPNPLQISRGWALAGARTWNDHSPDAFVRLLRGGAGFLHDTSKRLRKISRAEVYSPAILEGSHRVWIRSGYEPAFPLHIMERSLHVSVDRPNIEIHESSPPDLERIVAVDNAAFEPFWAMSSIGLAEALGSTKASIILTVEERDRIAGYAMVGAQWGTSYLQRLAVEPASSGRGYGADLVRAALAWGRRNGSATMVLNVKPGNRKAIALYERLGFVRTPSPAHVYRYAA